MSRHIAAISIAIAGLMMVACGASGGAIADRSVATSAPESTVVTQTFVVRNTGATVLPSLILTQEGGDRHEIPALPSGQSLEIPFQTDLTLQDIILIDVRDGEQYGVQGALHVGIPEIMYGDSLLTVSADGHRLSGWITPLEFPKGVPGGAGYPLYDAAASRQGGSE